MKYRNRKTYGAVEEISNSAPSGFYKNIIWSLVLNALLVSGSLYVAVQECGKPEAGMFRLVLMAVVTLVCCGISEKDMQVKRWKLIWRILPWILMLVLSQWHGYWSGAKYWINMIISRWNLIHDGGVALFRTTAGEQEEVAFLLLAVTALIQLGWWIVRKRRLCIATVYGLCWMFLALFTGIFHPLAVCTLFCAFLGLRLSDRNMNTVRRKLFWFVCLGVFAAAGALTLPAQDLLSVTEFREQVKTEIHTWRYGEDSLPEGNLRQAEMLHDSSNEMLRVQSEQIKMMYFRGFIGGRYSDGQWSQMPDSAYGGENAGILNWLSEHGFDPMTQVADYYGLCTEDNLPETNDFQIRDVGAASCYVYAPVTLQKLSGSGFESDQDSRLTGKGFHGQKTYQGTERSSFRPAELTVAEDWINDPQTDAQKQYCEAEAVYRKFVYQTYTQVEPDLADTLQELFWDTYDSENDGIYSAVTQVRNVLRDTMNYAEYPSAAPEDTDPVLWFLTDSQTGNAVQFASAAVEALRLHGIPARYVEGYFPSSEEAQANAHTEIALSGQDAHAWVEVYFDGIGWLPVDVTPGYYYDTISLQQMISLPEQTQNSVSFDQSAYKAAELEETGQRHRDPQAVETLIKNTFLFILGIIAGLVILLSVVLTAFEIHRIIRMQRIKKVMKRATQKQWILYKQKFLYRILKIWGIEASLGWHTKEVDQRIAEQFSDIESGEYTKVCGLIEKVIYGGQKLEVFEERVIDCFLRKVLDNDLSAGWKRRIKLRYQIMRGIPVRI
ncbi:transglutaminase family protein [uncultured Eubacterium sp.]|uniref:transglutaminase-like domain-containing protein n=1 Tax=uncultured Eubacterium sp. TaxID=165185 RepID=UPI0025D36D6A|nr:transglutaminase-like domain-containing protein [uncultured Eubacterium sp.]